MCYSFAISIRNEYPEMSLDELIVQMYNASIHCSAAINCCVQSLHQTEMSRHNGVRNKNCNNNAH